MVLHGVAGSTIPGTFFLGPMADHFNVAAVKSFSMALESEPLHTAKKHCTIFNIIGRLHVTCSRGERSPKVKISLKVEWLSSSLRMAPGRTFPVNANCWISCSLFITTYCMTFLPQHFFTSSPDDIFTNDSKRCCCSWCLPFTVPRRARMT